MSLYIQSNVASLQAQQNFGVTQNSLQNNFEQLSSGYRINSAADDPAGVGISANLTSQIDAFGQAGNNTNNAISMAQTADGALAQVGNILDTLNTLAVQASNGDLQVSDRANLDNEFQTMSAEIDRITQSTNFNGTELLGGAVNTVAFQVGINNSAEDQISVAFGGVGLTTLGIDGQSLTGADGTNAEAAITAVQGAIQQVSLDRANFGSAMDRFQATASNIQSVTTNLTAANSRIEDTDIASVTAQMSQNQVLAQAGAAVLSQANQAPQLALKLLGG
jgi:flagellin